MKLLGEDIRSEELLAKAKGIPYRFYASSAEPLTYEYLMKIAARRRHHKLRDKLNKGSLGYAGTHGSEDLRKEIAKLYGSNIGFDDIVVFPGAQTAMTSTALALLGDKAHSIIITPSYQSLEYGPKLAGSDITRVMLSPDNGWALDLNVLEGAIQGNTKYIVINEPQNPSGNLMSKDTQKKLVALAAKHHITIFSDEVYRFLEHNPSDRLPSIADLSDHGIALGTMSKAWGAGGLCVGWVACQDAGVIKKLRRAQYPFTVSVSRTAEIEAMIALRARKDIIAKNIRIIKKNLKLLDTFFARNKDLFEWQRPVAGCTAFVKFKGPMNGDAFAKALLDHGILVFPPYIFDCSNDTLGQYIRIGYSRTTMPAALAEFEKFIEAHRAQWHCIRTLPAFESSLARPSKGDKMHILQSADELSRLLSAEERKTFPNSPWPQARTDTTITHQVEMTFKSPACGELIAQGGYQIGGKHFVIKLSTQFKQSGGVDPVIKRTLTLVGNAQTGEIIALLPTGSQTKAKIKEMDWTAIQGHLDSLGDDAVRQLQKDGFVALSTDKVTVPEVLYLPFTNPRGKYLGDLHLKGAHSQDGSLYALKVATGFPGNKALDLSPSQGIMIAFDARTGEPLVVLKDEGNLTDLRTAIAGRNAAEVMMPPEALTGIGVIGTGIQARLQVQQLESFCECRKLAVWGRTDKNRDRYIEEMQARGWTVTIAENPSEVAQMANLIITATPSHKALLDADDIRPGTLIIAIGADAPKKLELTPKLLATASHLIVDSTIQSQHHGNAAVALKEGVINVAELQEFGQVISHGLKRPKNKDNIAIFLSCGVGVQDLQIVQAVITGAEQSALRIRS